MLRGSRRNDGGSNGDGSRNNDGDGDNNSNDADANANNSALMTATRTTLERLYAQLCSVYARFICGGNVFCNLL